MTLELDLIAYVDLLLLIIIIIMLITLNIDFILNMRYENWFHKQFLPIIICNFIPTFFLFFKELKHLAGPCFEFNDVKYPSPGFIFLLSDFKHLDNFLDSCFQLISHLQNNNIAHNLYITRGSSTNIKNEFNCIRLFVWGRTSSYGKGLIYWLLIWYINVNECSIFRCKSLWCI